MTPPYRFERTADAASLQSRFADLDPGTETGERVSVAGRLMLRRVQGKLAFGTLADSSGRVRRGVSLARRAAEGWEAPRAVQVREPSLPSQR